MIHDISEYSANDAWVTAANKLRAAGDDAIRPSRAGPTRDIGQTVVSISNPRLRWVVSRRPPINPAFAIAESLWILAGRQDAAFVNYFNRALPQYAGQGDYYYGAYGYRLRYAHGFDQLEQAYQALSSNAYSRQVVLQIWNARTDMPSSDGKPRSPDIPCNVASMLKIKGNSLDWTQVMRSNDVFRGMPYNIVQFTLLQEVFSGWLGVDVGDFHLFTDSLHAYETDLLNLMPANQSFPEESEIESLSLPKQESDYVIRILVGHIERAIHPDASSASLVSMASVGDLPKPYRNLLCVIVGEALRRKRDKRARSVVEEFCSNVWLRLVWSNWLDRPLKSSFERKSAV